MFFHSAARRKLASLLRPWLQADPELDLTLGFLNSRAVAKNLCFDVSVLNDLLDGGTGFLFDTVTVEELIVGLGFSSWSVPAISFQLNGVSVSLSLRDRENGTDSRPRDTIAECLKEKLSQVDPEGSFLHNILGKIAAIAPAGNKFKIAFSGFLLKICQLQSRDLNLQVRFPLLSDSSTCRLRLKELNTESQYLDFGCLLRGLVGLLVRHVEETSHSHTVSAVGFGIVLESVNRADHLLLSADLVCDVKLDGLQFVGFDVRVPELNVSFSPGDLSVCLALANISPKSCQCTRNGRQLWKIVASRMGHVISSPALKFYDLVVMIGLWLRYVIAYEYLIRLIGYSSDPRIFKQRIGKISRNKTVLKSFKKHWKVISDIEQELPYESVGQARRIARHRAALNAEFPAFGESCSNTYAKFVYGICPLLEGVCKLIRTLFHLILWLLSLRWQLAKEAFHEKLETVLDDSSPDFCFSLNLGRVLVSASPVKEMKISEVRKLESQFGIYFSDYVVVSLEVDTVLLKLVQATCEESFVVSCGQFKLESSSVLRTPQVQGSSKKFLRSAKIKEMKSTIWCEPAPSFPRLETNKVGTAESAEDNCDPFLEKILGELWSMWKRTCLKLENSEIRYFENPCLLIETRSSYMYPQINNSDSGLWKGFVSLGKLNLDISVSSIISISVLLRQFEDSLFTAGDTGRSKALFHAPNSAEDVQFNLFTKCKSYGNALSGKLLRILPEKHIQLGIFMAGPCIKLCLGKEFGGGINQIAMSEDVHLAVDIKTIELAVWPTLKFDSASNADLADTELTRLKQPPIIEIPKSEDGKYISDWWFFLGSYFRINGLDAYLEDSEGKHKDQIFVLQPITVQLTSSRAYFHSFSSNVSSLSSVFSASATGMTLLAYMEELYLLSQMVACIYSAISYVLGEFNPGAFVLLETSMSSLLQTEMENEEESSKVATSISSKIEFVIEGLFKIEPLKLIIQKTRMKDGNGKSTKTPNVSSKFFLAGADLPDCGILISIPQTSIDISCEEEVLKLTANVSDFQSVIFRYQNAGTKSTEQSRDLLPPSHHFQYEISLPNCRFSVSLIIPQNTSASGSIQSKHEDFTPGKNTGITSCNESEVTSNQNISSISSYSLSVDIELGLVYLGSCSLKSGLIGAHEPSYLNSSLSVGGDFQTISLEIEGGVLYLETKAMEKFNCVFLSYLQYALKNLCEKQLKKPEHTVRDDTLEIPLHGRGKHVQALNISISRLTPVLVIEDEKGGVKELVLELEVHLNSKMENSKRKVIFDLKQLSFLSQVLLEGGGNELQIPHIYSLKLNSMVTSFESGDTTSKLEDGDMMRQLSGLSSSRDSNSLEIHCVPEILEIRHQKHILKHLGVLLSVEKDMNSQAEAWAGNGSILGFDIIVSLVEIEMILCVIASFSGLLSKLPKSEVNGKRKPGDSEEIDRNIEPMVPDGPIIGIKDGSIIGIKDMEQHMYFTVEGEASKYSLVGAPHYSLVGQRALFRVKYHLQKRWRSSVLWFSLESLHAKNASGEPLLLNYLPGSGFVGISSTADGPSAQWKLLPYPCENDSNDWEHRSNLVRKNFYLVNRKNDCSVAFVDEVPAFVKKPGNPFKLKVFSDGTSFHRLLPCIDIVFDNKLSLTVVHELSDSVDVFPLLRASIDSTQLVLQLLSTKARIISTSKAAIDHFDSQRHSWRELVHPVEIFIFYRSYSGVRLLKKKNPGVQDSAANSHGVPVHFHCRTKELSMSVSELSLDVLLFVIGKLDLAGPYSVKSSRILADCCKVENQTGLNLVCQFSKQRVKVAKNQSTSIYLRYSDPAHELPENASASFQLSVLGSFTTTPIHLSFLQPQKLAWKTRIMSSQGSSTYPGPFVIVDISRESEDGLAISASPLIKIHNETRFSMELRFRRPQQKEDEFALVVLNSGDLIDDSIAMFDALHLSGGSKKALRSISLGNFLLSFRPKTTEGFTNSESPITAEWSDDFKGGKAVRLSGIFDKLSYNIRKALLNKAAKCTFSTVQCSLNAEDTHITDMHFLIQIVVRDVPVVNPTNSEDGVEYSTLPTTLMEQKEIFLLPTVKVSNFLQSDVHVALKENNAGSNIGIDNNLNQAIISSDSSMDFYVDPSVICFTVTLTSYKSSCKPLNSSDWIKKLQKQKSDVQYLDIDLDFDGGRYFASLRLSRGHKGILEATIFTPYALKNYTDFCLYIIPPNRKPLSRDEVEKFGDAIPPELGLLVPPKLTRSWFLKSNKVRVKRLEDCTSEAVLDLDALSGLTEISLEIEESSGMNSISKLGVSVGPLLGSAVVPSQLVTMVPRYVVVNESEMPISVRQFYLQDDTVGTGTVESGQRMTLQLWNVMSKTREFSFFETLIRNHRKANDDERLHIQFRPNGPDLGWSGPVCIASLGRFFLKFRKQTSQERPTFAFVEVMEEGSTRMLRYQKPPRVSLPYRIENCLRDVSISYYQKESTEQEVIGSESSVDYVWDDLTLPHRLVVRINDTQAIREINLNKVREWISFYKPRKQLALHFLLDKNAPNVGETNSNKGEKAGFEVYADGPTRVLRMCEKSDIHRDENSFQSCQKIQLQVPRITLSLIEHRKQDENDRDLSVYTPILAARFGHFGLRSLFTDQQKYNLVELQSLIIEPKWDGAPVAALLRRHQVENAGSNDCILRVVFVLLSTSSDVRHVKSSSIALQPIELNLDEETLMKIVTFWRTSLADPNTKSRQYYFDHFAIHPIKIITSFLPGESYSSYSSAQETLRSLLHSVIKVPTIKNMVVELNAVIIAHALITMHELSVRCARHYSWYAMRAIYIAKGSPLLPPDFASMFDDLASSSLDIFFDPSRGLINLPGFTSGTFKLISKYLSGKGGFPGRKRYLGDLGQSIQKAGSKVLFTAVTEISDSVLKGAEATGFNGMMTGFNQGILKLAMKPSLLGSALLEGGPDRKIKLDRSPGVDELYIEGYLQAMLDNRYGQEYLRVRVIDNQVCLKNLPPNSGLIEEIMETVKGHLVSKALLKGDPSRISHPLRHLRGDTVPKIGPTVLTLIQHVFVSFAIRELRKHANNLIAKTMSRNVRLKAILPLLPGTSSPEEEQKVRFIWRWGISRFVLNGVVAYIDGRLCRSIPDPIARRIVSGFLLSFLDNKTSENN